MRRGRLSLAGQAFVWQLVVLALMIGTGTVLAVLDTRRDHDAATELQVRDVALTVARAPSTLAAVNSPYPSGLLQPTTERIRADTGMDFIVVMATDRTRYTHTNPDMIGQPFVGSIDEALAGRTFTETFTGTLGPSIRAVSPVFDSGEVVALVSAGVTRDKIGAQVASQIPVILGVSAGGLALAALSSFLISRRLRRQTHGLAPDELRALYEHHDAVLHSVHEGLVVFGAGPGPAEVVNDQARTLLDLPEGPVRRTDLPVSMQQMSWGVVRDETHVTTDRILLVNQDVVSWEGKAIGTVLTIRDQTELRAVLGELDSVRSFAESLRSQAHEAANRLHTVVTMVELGRPEEAVAFATAELQLSQVLIDRLLADVGDAALAALLLGKVDQAAERGVTLAISEDTALDSADPLSAHEAVTLVGNLVDNAIDAAAGTVEKRVEVAVHHRDSDLLVRVADSGPGMSAQMFVRAAERGYTTKSDHAGLGLALVHRLVDRHGGAITTTAAPHSAVIVTIPLRETP